MTGSLKTLYTFLADSTPFAALVEGSNGELYGTSEDGGNSNCNAPYGCGSVFKITLNGTLTTLHAFCSESNCSDGQYPYARLVQATDGNFYGTTQSGGSQALGTIFRITPSGGLTTIYSFCSQPKCRDGASPTAGLIQATDGNLYGTAGGGANGGGTIFKINFAGVLTTLHSFDQTDGASPQGTLIQATDGNFYGTTSFGGSSNQGTIFALDVGLGPFVALVRGAAKSNQSFGILGQRFIGTTSVLLNGTPAMFSVKSDTLIVATVPTGAASGYVTVTTPSGTLTSSKPFYVIP
jgi:uncharacterized repeat protein (TIGR03803 family)